MRLFISEKPSLAAAVAKVLPGAVRKDGAVTYVGDDAFVALVASIFQTRQSLTSLEVRWTFP